MSGNMPPGVTENDPYFNDDPDGLEEDEEEYVCEFHDVAVNDDGECPVCLEDMKRQQAYYGSLYRAENHYSREEIEEALSHPAERSKRDILLSRIGG